MIKHFFPKKIHFIGIGGISMSGLAYMANHMGCDVTGSDIQENQVIKNLINNGVNISLEHTINNIQPDTNFVIHSDAIDNNNPEIEQAKKYNIPCIRRAVFLNTIATMFQPIAIAGTHGKTSTTSLLIHILLTANCDPSFLVGGILNNNYDNAHLGKDPFFIYEACEAFGSINHFQHDIGCILNIDLDHMDYYSSIHDLKENFLNFINRTPFYGKMILNTDDEHIASLIPSIKKTYTSIGIKSQNTDLYVQDIEYHSLFSTMNIIYHNKILGNVTLNVPGEHNIYNMLAAIAICLEINIPFSTIHEALKVFKLPHRRFEVRGWFQEALLIDDYAHHPTEIEATINTALHMKKSGEVNRVIVAFQPHLYSRTQEHHKEIAKFLSLADYTILAPIYKAREAYNPNVTLELVTNIWDQNQYKTYQTVDKLDEVVQYLKTELKKGDLFITMGAGDIYTVLDQLDE